MAGVVVVAVLTWHVSNRIGNGALSAEYDHRGPLCDDAVVQAVGDGTVTLKPLGDDSRRVRRGPRWGLRWRQGWGEVGPVAGVTSEGVTRRFAPGEGTPAPGTHVDPSAVRARSDPLRACHLAEPAWFVPGEADTWALFVHGKGANRTEALPTLGIYAARDLPCLVISYRLSCPTLFIFGSVDSNVPVDKSIPVIRRGMERAGNKNYLIRVFPRGRHDLFEGKNVGPVEFPRMPRFVPGYWDAMADWAVNRVKG